MLEIRYSAEFEKEFLKLKKKALAGNSEAKYLIEIIGKATLKLSENREAGKKIQKRLWPKEYVKKFEVNNLWKYNLDSYWRLIYTLTGSEIDLFLIYLEYLPHRVYDRKFHY